MTNNHLSLVVVVCDKHKHELKQLLAIIMVFGLPPTHALFIRNEPKTTKSHTSMCTNVPACLNLPSRDGNSRPAVFDPMGVGTGKILYQ
jgi:hypothetical protein